MGLSLLLQLVLLFFFGFIFILRVTLNISPQIFNLQNLKVEKYLLSPLKENKDLGIQTQIMIFLGHIYTVQYYHSIFIL